MTITIATVVAILVSISIVILIIGASIECLSEKGYICDGVTAFEAVFLVGITLFALHKVSVQDPYVDLSLVYAALFIWYGLALAVLQPLLAERIRQKRLQRET